MLKGAVPTPPAEADIDVYVSVDVFGTIRSRTDWHLVNEESLIAKTALEIMAISRNTGMVLISPQTASFEAEYSEQYYLWAGPFETKKQLRRSAPLLADFTDLTPQDMKVTRTSGVHVPY